MDGEAGRSDYSSGQLRTTVLVSRFSAGIWSLCGGYSPHPEVRGGVAALILG